MTHEQKIEILKQQAARADATIVRLMRYNRIIMISGTMLMMIAAVVIGLALK